MWKYALSYFSKLKRKSSPHCDITKNTPKCIPSTFCKIDPIWPQPKVVIIGAGMAGLSAAQYLFMSGIHDFVILEASDKIGGRIHSVHYGDAKIEFGIDTVYGCPSDSVFRLACVERLIKSPMIRLNSMIGAWHVPNENRLVKNKIVTKARSRFREIERTAALAHEQDPLTKSNCPKDLFQFIDEYIQNELKGFFDDEAERDDLGRVMYALTNNLRTKLGAKLQSVPAHLYSSNVEMPGGLIRVESGMIGTITPLMKHIPTNSLKTSKRVISIRWGAPNNTSPRSLVVTEDGQDFPADYVICTCSLGILKHTPSLFCPELPARQWEAIQRLGFADVCKIYALYAQPFWLPGTGHINFAWSKADLQQSPDCQWHWSKGVSGIHEVPGSTNVLNMTVTDKDALTVEVMDNAILTDEIHALLCKFRNDPHLVRPTHVTATKWSTNPNFLGFKTYMNTSSDISHIHDLASPLSACNNMPPVIGFAGEHTSPEYYGTLHGSRMSGIREANRIVEYTMRYKGPPIPYQDKVSIADNYKG
ncbi:spermine oxidase-like [Daktulosphaira vitifoliae]|uniref:spermine oxidase-like n=1 Tax=Daktulosphaira vitifoliae TaxID=58002 RepID=UPI0021AA4164|nr:spermine oxidase-like [Daktulosphaira vitifoliae]XP_050530781.1 spermine oxidase-like [Daktulosphaira vitifoliae]